MHFLVFFIILATFTLFANKVHSKEMYMGQPKTLKELIKDDIKRVDRKNTTTEWLIKEFTISDRSIAEDILNSIKTCDKKRPCPCPYNTKKDDTYCHAHSSYKLNGGCEPLCYPKDVIDKRKAK